MTPKENLGRIGVMIHNELFLCFYRPSVSLQNQTCTNGVDSFKALSIFFVTAKQDIHPSRRNLLTSRPLFGSSESFITLTFPATAPLFGTPAVIASIVAAS